MQISDAVLSVMQISDAVLSVMQISDAVLSVMQISDAVLSLYKEPRKIQIYKPHTLHSAGQGSMSEEKWRAIPVIFFFRFSL